MPPTSSCLISIGGVEVSMLMSDTDEVRGTSPMILSLRSDASIVCTSLLNSMSGEWNVNTDWSTKNISDLSAV